jgi:hypothetical protein
MGAILINVGAILINVGAILQWGDFMFDIKLSCDFLRFKYSK